MIEFVLGEQRLRLLTQLIFCVTLRKVPEN